MVNLSLFIDFHCQKNLMQTFWVSIKVYFTIAPFLSLLLDCHVTGWVFCLVCSFLIFFSEGLWFSVAWVHAKGSTLKLTYYDGFYIIYWHIL